MDAFDHKPPLPGLDQIDIDRIQAALLGLTQYHRRTKKDLVREQCEAIELALSRGVGYAAVATVLTEGGCPMTARVLRKYLSQIRQERRRGQPRAARGDGGSSPGSDPSVGAVSSRSPDVAAQGAAGRAEPRRSLRRSAFVSMNTSGSDE